MKEIKAFKNGKGVEALTNKGFESVTLSESEATGNFKREGSVPSLKYHFTDSKMIKLELVCQDEDVEIIIEIISKEARTPYPADGILYISDVIDAFKIKTGKSCKE